MKLVFFICLLVLGTDMMAGGFLTNLFGGISQAAGTILNSTGFNNLVSTGGQVANTYVAAEAGIPAPQMNPSTGPTTQGAYSPKTSGSGTGSQSPGSGPGFTEAIEDKWYKRFFNPYKILDNGFYDLKDMKPQYSWGKIGTWIVGVIAIIWGGWKLLTGGKKSSGRRRRSSRKRRF